MIDNSFFLDAAVLVVSFFGALISLIRLFSGLTPKAKDKLWMGPVIFFMPGYIEKKARSDLIRFLIFFGLGVLYFAIYVQY